MSVDGDQITDPGARALLEQLTDGGTRIVFVRDHDKATIHVSDNVPTVTGWDAVAFADDFYSYVIDEDLPAVIKATRALRSEGKREHRIPVRVRAEDGRTLQLDLHAYNHLDDASIGGIVVVLTPLGPIDDPASRWTALLALTTELLVIQRLDSPHPAFVAPSCEGVLGYSPDELARVWTEILHPDDLETVMEATQRLFGTPGSESRHRVRVRHADGHWLTLDSTFANHVDDPLIGGLLIRARDISELVAREHEVEREQRRFEAMVTNGPGATVLIDPDSTITFCSAGITILLGHQPDDLVGAKGIDFVHPDDHEAVAEHLALLLVDPTVPDPTFRMRHADGHYEWIGVTAINMLDHPVLRSHVLALRNRGEQMLADERLHRLLRDASGATFVITDDAHVTWTTPGIERFLGEHRHMGPEVVRVLVSAADADAVTAAHRRVIAGGHGTSERILCQLGPSHDQRGWVDLTITNATDDPTIEGSIVNIHDVDDAVQAGEAGNRLTAVLENTTDFVSIFDGELNLVWRNAAASGVFGPAPQPTEQVMVQIPEETQRLVVSEVLGSLDEHGSWRGEFSLRTSQDDLVPVEVTVLQHDSAGGERYFSMMGRDITERKRLESRLEARARHDQLTGLPNRLFLSERLEAALDSGDDLAVLFIDLDQFKAVNDSQGHDIGDRLLVTASERLRNALRPTDLVARFGGDEFVVLLPGVSTAMDAVPLAERVLSHLRGPVQTGPIPVYLTGSAGIAVADGSDATTLISNADAAMYRAKSLGRDRVAVFTSELRSHSQQRLETAHRLRSALEDEELEVWFQPIVDTASGRPIAAEALVRWRHPVLGDIPTEHLIEVAEETGMILRLGTAVIAATCESMAAVDDLRSLQFTVNLSAHQLADPALISALERSLAANDVDPGRLVCEITESAVMLDVDDSARVLDRIRELGVGIAIDDFGTGYSSLAYLQRFPVDVLKIDREFVVALTADSDWKRSLAAGIISLGHSLGLRVMAEGVESSEQATILTMLGCDAMQGFLFSEAVPLAALPDTLNRLRSASRPIG